MVQSRSYNWQIKEEKMYISNKQMWENKKYILSLSQALKMCVLKTDPL